ncbi:MAG TPA: amidohydrolase [Gemmatimonadales bacterium]|nr:amidohydrolase [Gemmatimonadales bacterium]
MSLCRRAGCSLAGSALLVLAACSGGPKADLVLYGRVWTGDSARPYAAAVAVRGDSIVAVGDSAMVARMVGGSTTVLAPPGGFVAPGFMDDHVHLLSGGFQLASVDLRDAATPEEFTRRIKVFAQTLKPGEWITGGDWDHEKWPGTPLPDRAWIDSVTPQNPVFVNRLDGHMALANSLALAAARLDRAAREIPGGTIVRRAGRELSGVLKDEAMNPVFAAIPAPSPSQLDSALARAMTHAASLGVVGVSSVSTGWNDIAALQRARARGALTLRVSNYIPLAAWREMAESLKAGGPGDDWIRSAGVKGFVDGSLGSTTALMFAPYLDAPATRGLFVTPEDSLRRWIGAADSAGLQVAVHAIGDRANALLLDIYDSVAKAHGPRDRRFRIEHAQHLRAQDLPRFGAQGVIPSMQPYHEADDGRWAAKRIRPDLIKGTYAFRSLLDSKARLAFGSDWTVAPLDPLVGMQAAVTRQTLDGKNPEGWVPEQKVSIDEALRSYTVNNAYAVFAESRRGMLKPGFLADLVVLDRDLTRIPPTSLADARVIATVVGGKLVYRKEPGPGSR